MYVDKVSSLFEMSENSLFQKSRPPVVWLTFCVSSNNRKVPTLSLNVLRFLLQLGQDNWIRGWGHRRVHDPILRVLLLLPVLPSGQEETARTSPQAGPGISTATGSATSTTTHPHAPPRPKGK